MNKHDQDLFDKIENEGGVWEAMIYGIQGADFQNKVLGNLWDEALAKIHKLFDWIDKNE